MLIQRLKVAIELPAPPSVLWCEGNFRSSVRVRDLLPADIDKLCDAWRSAVRLRQHAPQYVKLFGVKRRVRLPVVPEAFRGSNGKFVHLPDLLDVERGQVAAEWARAFRKVAAARPQNELSEDELRERIEEVRATRGYDSGSGA